MGDPRRMQNQQAYGQPPMSGHMVPVPPPPPPPARVVVTDIDMKFGTMIIFMIKWAIAAIPATIILGLIGGVLMTIFLVIMTALGLAAGAASH